MARRSAVGIAAGAVVGPSRSREWLRRRAPWLLAALLLFAAGVASVAWFPLRAEPLRPAPLLSPAWWLEPIEQDAFLRLPVITSDVNGLAIAPDGQTAVAVGDNGLVVRSTDGGVLWHLVQSGTTNNLEAVAIAADGRTAVAAGDGGAALAHAEKVGTEQEISTGLLRRLADGDINFVSVLQNRKDTVVGAAMNEAIAALPSLGLPDFQPIQAQAARFVGLWTGVTVRA